jgi:hypothetical protein
MVSDLMIRKGKVEECDATNVEESDKAGLIIKKTPALRGRRCNAVDENLLHY